MFNNVIIETALTTPFANSYFRRINGEYFLNDSSFVATLRALLADKIDEKEDAGIYLVNRYTTLSLEQIRRKGPYSALEEMVGGSDNFENTNQIIINNVSSAGSDNVQAVFKLINDEFEKNFDGWTRIEKVTAFFQKSFAVTCFVNKDLRSVFISVANMDIRRYHYLQCAIFAFLPWYFDVERGLTPKERELINTLLHTDSEAYLKCISDFAEKYDFREASIKNMLSGFELRYERQRMSQIEREIQNMDSTIDNYNMEISRALTKRRDFEIELMGLGLKISNGANGDSEIMRYFLANKRLVLESVDDNYIIFGIRDYLCYYDENQVKATLLKQGGYVDSCRRGSISTDDMRMLMTALFVDEELKLRVCAKYQFRLTGNVSAVQHATYSMEYDGYMPNTHIDQFGCLGNYNKVINELLKRNDYIGAIEQCIASCKSLNFVDYSVMRRFVENMYDSAKKCIELPNGNVVTPKEAIKYLKENKGSEE